MTFANHYILFIYILKKQNKKLDVLFVNIYFPLLFISILDISLLGVANIC